MKKYCKLLLLISFNATSFAEDVGSYCGFYLKMLPTKSGYQVVKTSANYINSSNVLYAIYDLNAKNYKLLTIPKSDNPNFQCNSEYGDSDSEGYCSGDFVLDENNVNKEQASNAITESLKSVTSSLGGFLGANSSQKRKTDKPFTPYPNVAAIKMAQEKSDLLTSQFTQIELSACAEEQKKQAARKKAEEEQLRKVAQLEAQQKKQAQNETKTKQVVKSNPHQLVKCNGIYIQSNTPASAYTMRSGDCIGNAAYANCEQTSSGIICERIYLNSHMGGGRGHWCTLDRKGDACIYHKNVCITCSYY